MIAAAMEMGASATDDSVMAVHMEANAASLAERGMPPP